MSTASTKAKVPGGHLRARSDARPGISRLSRHDRGQSESDEQRHDLARALRQHAGEGLVLGRRAHPSHARQSGRSRVWGMVAAEDVYVGNLLEMGNISGTHFKQPKEWGKASRFERDGHFIVVRARGPAYVVPGSHDSPQPADADPREAGANTFSTTRCSTESHRQGGVSGFRAHGLGPARRAIRRRWIAAWRCSRRSASLISSRCFKVDG